MCVSTFKKKRKLLQKLGWIEWERRDGNTNEYTVHERLDPDTEGSAPDTEGSVPDTEGVGATYLGGSVPDTYNQEPYTKSH